jgi:hypothetical protein
MDAANSLAHLNLVRHNWLAAQTNAAGFGDLKSLRRTTAPRRYFYVHSLLHTLFGRAIAGIPSGMPVSVVTGSPTLLSARPPHLAMSGGLPLHTEAAMRANALARPEQSPLVTTVVATPGYDAGKFAALTWLSQILRSAADHRDSSRCAYVRALDADDSSAAMASIEFNRGFAEGLAQAIAGVRHG